MRKIVKKHIEWQEERMKNMQLSEFCEYNQQENFESREAALEKLKIIFGIPEKIRGKDGTEYSFGQVIGKVTNCHKNHIKNREMVDMVILDSECKEILWDGNPVCFTRTNVRNRMKSGQYYLQSLFYNGREVFTRNPGLYEVSSKIDDGIDEIPRMNEENTDKFTESSAKKDVITKVEESASDFVTIYSLKDKLEAEDYHCNIKVLAQFLIGLHTNQIIILHGAPGMGKTSFVTHIARALGFEYRIIPVRPNWIDNQDLTGYFNPVEHRYYSTAFLDALCEAKENPEKEYLICLDEMNLAHVEYYFSDVLSSMESGEGIPLYARKDWEDALRRLDFILKKQDKNTVEWLDAEIDQKNLKERYRSEFVLPKNVTFIGTLNMDATTNDLSPKVIDRSLIIRVTKEAGESLMDYETGNELAKEIEDSFEKRLLKTLNKQMSNRVEGQLASMRKKLDHHYLKGILSKQDFADMYLAMKVLPALNVEDVECILEEDKFQIGDFKIEGGDKEWKDFYPLTVEYLKHMCSPEEGILNYWKM